MSSQVCDCGKVCRSGAGLAAHRRTCVTHHDAVKIGGGQLSLIPPDKSGVRNDTEQAAGRDIRTLEAEGQIPPAAEALVVAYQLLARELDRTEIEHDRYGKINTAAKLLAVRKELAPLGDQGTPADLDSFWSDVSAHAGNGP